MRPTHTQMTDRIGKIGISMLLLGQIACGGGYLVKDSAPAPVKVAEVPKTPDAFRDHRGEKVKPGQKFRLAAKPIAVEGLNIVIELVKVDWSTMTAPSGKEMREAAAKL